MQTTPGNGSSTQGEPVRYLVFSGSLRSDSLNSRLAHLAAEVIRRRGGLVDEATLGDFDAPSYDEDVQEHDGFPAGPEEFRRRIEASDAFVIASPEYNASMPGGLKNALDWLSRYRPQPLNEQHALLMSASPSMVGGNRGLWALRVPLEHLGARVFPDMFSLAQAHQALTADGRLSSEVLTTRFEGNIGAFMDLVEAAKNYPCIRKAWIEFLGEPPTALTDRVE